MPNKAWWYFQADSRYTWVCSVSIVLQKLPAPRAGSIPLSHFHKTKRQVAKKRWPPRGSSSLTFCGMSKYSTYTISTSWRPLNSYSSSSRPTLMSSIYRWKKNDLQFLCILLLNILIKLLFYSNLVQSSMTIITTCKDRCEVRKLWRFVTSYSLLGNVWHANVNVYILSLWCRLRWVCFTGFF